MSSLIDRISNLSASDFKKKFLITVCLVIAFFAAFDLLISRSDGFAVASKYLRDNPEVIKLVGTVSETSLIPFTSHLKDEGSQGNATYHIKVVGALASLEGVVTSIKTDGNWRVEKAHLLLKDKAVVVLKE